MPKSRNTTPNKNTSNKSPRNISYLLLSGWLIQNILSLQPIPCAALGIPILSSNHSDMSLPTYEKLIPGAGPATNDQAASDNQSRANSSGDTNLSPLTLTDPAPQSSEENNNGTDTIDSAVLKSSVSTTDYVSHDNPDVLQSQSINSKKPHKHKKDHSDESWSQQASEVKVGPLPLLESDNETQKKADTINDAERQQITDLWEAALTRNPDIQFVIQKLQPTSNPAHLANILARMLSTVAYGGLGAMSMMSPNMGTFAAASMGGSMMQTALGITQSKADKKAKLTNEEQTIMYNMVRTTCDKLVSCYRAYKKYWNSLTRATGDLQDLQSMVAEARSGQDSAKQLEMEYTLRKQQRDLDALADDLRGHRQSLIDLAGAEAVEKLDKELFDERSKLNAPDNQISEQPAASTGQAPGNAQGDPADKNIDSAENIASEKNNKTQTASALSPQS